MRKDFYTTIALGQLEALEKQSLQFREDVYPYTDYDDIKEQFTLIKESLINLRQNVEDNTEKIHRLLQSMKDKEAEDFTKHTSARTDSYSEVVASLQRK